MDVLWRGIGGYLYIEIAKSKHENLKLNESHRNQQKPTAQQKSKHKQ